MKRAILSLIVIAALPACKAMKAADATISMQDQMGNMLSTTKDMQKETSKLTSAIHLQKLDAALKTIYAPENTKEYFPPSSGLIAGAEVFAKEATAKEIVEYTYVVMKEVDKTAPKESRRGPDGKFPADYIEQFNHEKMVKLTALQAIAAQAPQSVIEEMIQAQVFNGGGRYEDTVYNVLMLRALFLQSYYLQEGVLAKPVNNIGKLESAYEYLKLLQFITSQPFADKIALKTVGIVAPGENLDEKLDLASVKELWRQLVKAIDTQMPGGFKADNSPYARRIAEIRADAARYAEAR